MARAEKEGTRRVTIIFYGPGFGIFAQEWRVRPGLAPAPFFDWVDVDGSYKAIDDDLEALQYARRLLLHGA